MTKLARLRLAILIITIFAIALAIAFWPILVIMLVVVTVGWAIFEIIDFMNNRYCQGSDDFEGDDSGPK
jgi:fatty acid desaturase